MNAVGCFIFQGSFTVGVAKRFKVIAHLEDGDFGVATFKLNFPDVPVHTVVEDWPLGELAGKVDLLYGNPPCAPFSPIGATISSKKKGIGQWRADDRIKCWHNLMLAVATIKPMVFVGESVPRFYTAGWELSGKYAKHLLSMGYMVYIVLHDIKFMGAAQQRRRVFLVGSKVKLDWPVPGHKPVTVRDAIGDLNDPGEYMVPRDEIVEILPYMPTDNKSLVNLYDKAYGHMTREEQKKQGLHRPRFVEGRSTFDRQIGTVFGNTMLHPEEVRYLGLRELMRLMGYPDDYRWSGNLGEAIGEMVKAVTPFAGRYAANVVADGLKLDRRVRKPKVIEVVRWAKSSRILDMKVVPSETDITGRLP